MTLLLLGIVLFFAVHLVPAAPALRARMVEGIGAVPYRIGFSLVALAGVILMVIGKARAPYVELWQPLPGSRPAAMVLMLPVFSLLAAAHMPSNLKRFTPHPMLWGITLWAAAHLLANGDLASVWLFGAFLVYAQFDRWSANRRGAACSLQAYPVRKDLMVVVAGLLVYAALLFAHPYLFRMPVIH